MCKSGCAGFWRKTVQVGTAELNEEVDIPEGWYLEAITVVDGVDSARTLKVQLKGEGNFDILTIADPSSQKTYVPTREVVGLTGTAVAGAVIPVRVFGNIIIDVTAGTGTGTIVVVASEDRPWIGV